MTDIYRRKPVLVEAKQFTGWNAAQDMKQWGADIFYVPAGYDHRLRRPNEYDRVGYIQEFAKEMLVLYNSTGEVRVDVFDWVVTDDPNHENFWVVENIQFKDLYEKEEPVSQDGALA